MIRTVNMLRKQISVIVMMLFVINVKYGQPLKCFQCYYFDFGSAQIGEKSCIDIKPSDTTFLTTCNASTKSCWFEKNEKTIGRQVIKTWSRRCSQDDRIIQTKLTNWTIYCKRDACNVIQETKSQPSQSSRSSKSSQDRQTPSMLAMMSLSWVVLRVFHHLYPHDS